MVSPHLMKCSHCAYQGELSKKYDLLGLTSSQHVYFERIQDIIRAFTIRYATQLRAHNAILRDREIQQVSIDERDMVRHPDDLLYSDEVRVYFNKQLRAGILVIYRGIAYVISKDPSNLRRGSWRELKEALLVSPFDILDGVEKVVLPGQKMNNWK